MGRRRGAPVVLVAVALLAGAPAAAVASGVAVGGVVHVAPPPGGTTAAPLPAAVPVAVRAPSIGLDAALLPLGLDPAGALEVPPDGTAAGWYTGGPTPGELGPAVLAAHVDWNGAPAVFADLGSLRPGDPITVARADGSVARFAVRAVHRYAKDRFPGATVYGDLDHAGLRLVTCGGRFDGGTRSYRDNVVVYAALGG
jgi:hypothetical protein